MAIKYGRGGYAERPGEGKLYTGPETGTGLSPRRRLLYIYIGILMFSVVMLVFYGLGLQQSLALLPEEEGLGVVVDKEIEADSFIVTVEIDVLAANEPDAPTTTLSDDVRVPKESYDLVDVGDTLHVTYQLNESRTGLVVRELGVVETEPAE